MKNPEYNDVLKRVICDLVDMGLRLGDALKYVGLTFSKYREYCMKYPELKEAVEKFEVNAKIRAVKVIKNNIERGNVKDAQWFLNNRFSDEWQSKQKIDVKEVKEPVEEIAARQERLRKYLSKLKGGKVSGKKEETKETKLLNSK